MKKHTNNNRMIAVILPTRGMVFTQVEEALEKIRANTWQETRIYRSWDKPIPDGINELTELALSHGATHVWYVEEDTVPPPDALRKLLYVTEAISFIDYGVAGWSCSAKDKETGEVLWCGLGCTMVKRHVFEALEKPYFRTDKKFRLNTREWVDAGDRVYGGHDIWFCMHARAIGATIRQIEGECKHLGLKKMGLPQINTGLHTIIEKSTIENQQVINLLVDKGGE